MSDEPRFEVLPMPSVDGWVKYAEWLERQPFTVVEDDGTETHYEPKTISDLVDEGVDEYTIEDGSGRP